VTNPPASRGADAPPLRVWRVGTLVYTGGGLAVLFFWLLWGDFAFGMRSRSIPAIVQLLFQKFGASDMLAGFLIGSLPAAIGLVVGPVVAYRSDRLRSRWGRRIPFLAVPIPFIVLAIAGLAFAPRLAGEMGGLPAPFAGRPELCTLLLMGVFWTVFEISCITADSLFAALINDVVPQEVIGRFYGLFRACGLVAGIIFNFWLMGKAETHPLWLFAGIGTLYGLGFGLMCLKVREGTYPPPPPVAHEGRRAGWLDGVRAYFRDGFGHAYYLWFFAVALLVPLTATPFNLYSVFYAKSVGMSLDAYGKCLAYSYGISLALAYPLGALADRFHPLRLTLAALALYGLVLAGGALWVRDAATFGVVLVAHGVLSGTLFTVSASLAQRLLPRARFAALGSAGGILNSLAGIALPPALGLFLDHTGHAYRYTFHAGFLLALAALGAGFVLHRRFTALGGPSGYRAPE